MATVLYIQDLNAFDCILVDLDCLLVTPTDAHMSPSSLSFTTRKHICTHSHLQALLKAWAYKVKKHVLKANLKKIK